MIELCDSCKWKYCECDLKYYVMVNRTNDKITSCNSYKKGNPSKIKGFLWNCLEKLKIRWDLG